MAHRDDHMHRPAATGPSGSAASHGLTLSGDEPWQPDSAQIERVDELIRGYRREVVTGLEPSVRAHYPELLEDPGDEYRKMLELSTKMTLVGHACCEIAGYPLRRAAATEREPRSAAAAFSPTASSTTSARTRPASTSQRIELLLTTGWFDVRTRARAALLRDRQPALRRARRARPDPAPGDPAPRSRRRSATRSCGSAVRSQSSRDASSSPCSASARATAAGTRSPC